MKRLNGGIADRLAATAKRLGYAVDRQRATTGSVYLSCWRAGISVMIRVSDHPIVHLPEKARKIIDVDPQGYSYAEAVELLKHPDRVEEVQLDPELRRQWADADRRRREEWQAVLRQIPPTLIRYYRSEQHNKDLRARLIARELGLDAGLVYRALNGGRPLPSGHGNPLKRAKKEFIEQERRRIIAAMETGGGGLTPPRQEGNPHGLEPSAAS